MQELAELSEETQDIALPRFGLIEPLLSNIDRRGRRGSSLSDGATLFGCYPKQRANIYAT
jgi:hypothetical protein